MKKRKITQVELTDDGKVMTRNPKGNKIDMKDKTEWDKLALMKDDDIDYEDLPELDESFFKKAALPWPPAKKQLTVRIDSDVLDWLKGQGKGYQTRINHILRAAMEHPGK